MSPWTLLILSPFIGLVGGAIGGAIGGGIVTFLEWRRIKKSA